MKTILVTKSNFLGLFGKNAIIQSPNNDPRNFVVILSKLNEILKKEMKQPLSWEADFFTKEIPANELYLFVFKCLNQIEEFKDWNLSKNEKDGNILLDDSKRCKYSFHSVFDTRDENSWKADFVDLDAFVNNLTRDIFLQNYISNEGDLSEFYNDPENDYGVRNVKWS